MAYIKAAIPGGKIPGRGWPRGLRGMGSYIATRTPGGKMPGRGWPTGLRGLQKPVFGRLGCACKKTLGQDEDFAPATYSAETGQYSGNLDSSGNYQPAGGSGYTQAQLATLWAQPNTPLTLNPTTGAPLA